MARKLLIPLSAAVAGALIAASPAAAATVTDCKGLQPALDNESESTVTLVQGLTCTGSWELPSRTITLQGAGTGATLRGDGESRILSGFNIGRATIRNLHFEHGRAFDSGGAIGIEGHNGVTISDSSFTDNDAGGSGGAVSVDMVGPRFQLQRTAQGGSQPVRVTITGNDFGGGSDARNTSQGGGGALSVSDDGPVVVSGNTFEGNTTHGSGGGANVSFCGTATIADNTFQGNNADGTPVLDRVAASVVFGGHAAGGGLAIGANQCFFQQPAQEGRQPAEAPPVQSTVEQTGNTFEANTITTGDNGNGQGAGEFAQFVELSSTDDVFDANEMGQGTIGAGGGLFVQPFGNVSLRNFVATANKMESGNGGGVGVGGFGDTLSIVHGTIAANAIGEGSGSGVFGQRGQSLLVDNSIIHGNTGGPEISGFQQSQPTRVAEGVAPGGVEIDYSLVCGADGKTPPSGDGNICADPKLANAAAGDVHQTAASPTLDKASRQLSGSLTKDFEGQDRFQDYRRSGTAVPDIGADEAPAPPLPQPQSQTPQPAPAAAGGVLGTQAQSCASKRSFRIKLRNHGQKVVKATVIVNGKRVKVLRGKRLTSKVDLRGLPKGRYSVQIRLKLANGTTLIGVRRYFTCRPGRKSGPPPV